MTRILSLLVAASLIASLIASPARAAGVLFGLPDLTFPPAEPPVTQSTAGVADPRD